MTREEKQKAIDTLKISVPIKALTQEEFNEYIQILNKIMDWLEQEPIFDKIRAEIEQKLGTHGNVSLYNRAIHDVLDVIDRHKAESEGKNGGKKCEQ